MCLKGSGQAPLCFSHSDQVFTVRHYYRISIRLRFLLLVDIPTTYLFRGYTFICGRSVCRGEAGISVSLCFTLSRPVSDVLLPLFLVKPI